MAQNTQYYGLKMPDKEDVPNVEDFNSNFTIIDDALKKHSENAADSYQEKEYTLGAYCIHDDVLYKSNTAITTPEAWTPEHWIATTVGAELAEAKAEIDALNASTSIPADDIKINTALFEKVSLTGAKKGNVVKLYITLKALNSVGGSGGSLLFNIPKHAPFNFYYISPVYFGDYLNAGTMWIDGGGIAKFYSTTPIQQGKSIFVFAEYTT